MILFKKGGPKYEIMGLTLHGKGIHDFSVFFVRATLAAWAVLILTSSTGFRNLMAGLLLLGVPFVFVSMLEFTWRYLYVFKMEITNTRKAADSRGYGVKWIWQIKTLGKIAGSLFIRSFTKGENIYNSMISRGYSKKSAENLKRHTKNSNSGLSVAGVVFATVSFSLFGFMVYIGI